MEALLVKLFNLDLVVLGVKELSASLCQLHAQYLDLVGEPFDFDGLEDYDELNVIAQVDLFVVGQVLDH